MLKFTFDTAIKSVTSSLNITYSNLSQILSSQLVVCQV